MTVIHYHTYFTTDEKRIISDWLDCQLEYYPDKLNLHNGMNYAVDVTDVIGRTAKVDIEIA